MASFNKVGDILRAKQGGGLIQDIISQADGQILRGEYDKITIRFLANYLVIEYEPEGAQLDYLTWNTNTIVIGESGTLTKKDTAGRQLSLETAATGAIDISGFTGVSTLEDGWQYQLKNGGNISKIIALRHFNVNREQASSQTNPLALTPTDIVLTIEAPYAKHRVSGSGSAITIKNNTQEETIEIR